MRRNSANIRFIWGLCNDQETCTYLELILASFCVGGLQEACASLEWQVFLKAFSFQTYPQCKWTTTLLLTYSTQSHCFLCYFSYVVVFQNKEKVVQNNEFWRGESHIYPDHTEKEKKSPLALPSHFHSSSSQLPSMLTSKPKEVYKTRWFFFFFAKKDTCKFCSPVLMS